MADSALDQLTQDLRGFSRQRDWERFHTPKNLAAILIGICLLAACASVPSESPKAHESPRAHELRALGDELFAELADQNEGRCRIGVSTDDGPSGAVILRVGANARQHGLQDGDIVLSIGDAPVANYSELLEEISNHRADDEVRVRLGRSGRTFTRHVSCINSGSVKQQKLDIASALSSANWRQCIASTDRLIESAGRSISLLSIRASCYEETRFNSDLTWRDGSRLVRGGYEYDRTLAQYYYAVASERIYAGVRTGSNAHTAAVLGTIHWLEKAGYEVFAARLKTELADAEDSIGAPEVSTRDRSSGTCFFVSPDGFVVTSNHVVNSASSIVVTLSDGTRVAASVHRASVLSDLVVLKTNLTSARYLSMADPAQVKPGDWVFTIGYPVPSLLGSEAKFADGSISSLSGLENEATLMQITVPVQPGNSGGPLVNEHGLVVGIVQSSASLAAFLGAAGTLPQNVNWAVHAPYAALLFEAPPRKLRSGSREDAISKARDAVCQVEAVF